jgi:hypothetical protein
MVLIVLLGAIAQLVAVSADCDIPNPNYKLADWTNVSLCATSLNVFEGNMR